MAPRLTRAVGIAALVGCAGQSTTLTERTSKPTDGSGGSAGSGTANGSAGTPEPEGNAGGPSGSCTLVKRGDSILEQQSDISALRGVRRLEGSLYVSRDASDLSALECLTEITGDLQIFEAPKLETLTGLEKLRTVGGSVHIGGGCSSGSGECEGNSSLRSI